MRTLLIALFASTLFISTGCNSKPDNKAAQSFNCKPYFQFDVVDHYLIDIDESNLWAMEGKEHKTEKETIQLELLVQDTLEKLSDTAILKNIEKAGFGKKEVPANKFGELNEIFCERKHKEVLATTCIPVFRDILVFKQRNRTIGTAKICFDCSQSIIAGSQQNTDEFGQSGDYLKLRKLLYGQKSL
jgi:hypothetical protein